MILKAAQRQLFLYLIAANAAAFSFILTHKRALSINILYLILNCTFYIRALASLII